MKETKLIQTPGAIKQREWRRKMSPEKRTAFLARRKERFADHGVHRQREYRAKHPGIGTQYAIAAYHKRPEHYKALQKLYRARMKQEVFAAYGNTCRCCGENEIEFLTIDHIVPVRKHRERMGVAFYQKLKNEGFPPGYQVLCFNCNMAKGSGGECPHRRIFMNKVKSFPTAESPPRRATA